MKIIALMCLILVGCDTPLMVLDKRTVTDSRGCKYRVFVSSLNGNMFLEELIEDNPHCKEPFK